PRVVLLARGAEHGDAEGGTAPRDARRVYELGRDDRRTQPPALPGPGPDPPYLRAATVQYHGLGTRRQCPRFLRGDGLCGCRADWQFAGGTHLVALLDPAHVAVRRPATLQAFGHLTSRTGHLGR